MSVPVQILAVTNMHGIDEDASIGKMFDSSNKFAFGTHTGEVLDEVVAEFSKVTSRAATALSSSEADCRAVALQRVIDNLGGDYTLQAAALPASELHIWIRGEGWVLIPNGAGFSYAFQLQVMTPSGPVDVRTLLELNGRDVAVDVLVAVQSN